MVTKWTLDSGLLDTVEQGIFARWNFSHIFWTFAALKYDGPHAITSSTDCHYMLAVT